MKKSNILFTFVLVLLMVVTIGSISAFAGYTPPEGTLADPTADLSSTTPDECGIFIEVYLDGDEIDYYNWELKELFGTNGGVYALVNDKEYFADNDSYDGYYYIDLIEANSISNASISSLIGTSYKIYITDNIKKPNTDVDILIDTVSPNYFEFTSSETSYYISESPLQIDYYSVYFHNRETGKDITTQYILEGQRINASYFAKSKYKTTFYYCDTDIVYKAYNKVDYSFDLDVEWTLEGLVLAPAADDTTAWYDVWWNTDNSEAIVNYANIFDAFTDIDNHWARNQIEFVVKRGLFIGTSDATFGPSTNMTNGMLMTVLYRNSGSPAVDAPASPYYAAPMAWGSSFITDYNGEPIDPNANGTREQLIYMLYNYAISCGVNVSSTADLSAYGDADQVTFVKAMEWAVSAGIIEGKPGDLLDPQSDVTRAEVAVIMQRFITSAGF